MRFLIDDYLNERVIRKVNIIDYKYVKVLLQRFKNGEEYLFQRLWLLINLHIWFVKNAL